MPKVPREREVLAWLAAGKADREIAEILGRSVRTVHEHLEHLYAKLGVETRTAAVLRALTLARRAGAQRQSGAQNAVQQGLRDDAHVGLVVEMRRSPVLQIDLPEP